MPILYVHGVNTRSREGFFTIEPLLRRHLAPVISNDPARVRIQDYYWGDLGIKLAWDGASRPRTQLLGKGAGQSRSDLLARSLAADENRVLLDQFPPPVAVTIEEESLVSAPGAPSGGAPARRMPPLTDLTQDQLADLLASFTASPADAPPPATEAEAKASGAARARLILAADKVAHDPGTIALLAGQSPERQVALLIDRLHAEAAKETDELAGKGFNDFWSGLKERLGEALDRSDDRLGYALSVLAAELRPKLNTMISAFLGDVFVYLHGRDDPKSHPGKILAGLIEKLKEEHRHKLADNEPLIVLTHSMGGQLVWDAVSFLLASDPATRDIRIDFWCASASQVGFFEEAKLFLASDPKHRSGLPVPFPYANLGVWWNVWDYNDFLSFTADGICDGVDDSAYNGGKSLIEAHGGYLARASFFRDLAEKISVAKARGFKTP